MRHRLFALLVLAASLLPPGPAPADDVAGVVSATGVRLQAHVDSADRLVVALVPPETAPLNGKLGVGFASPDEVWITDLPLVVKAETDYFDGAVLEKLAFDPRRLDTPAVLAVTFGACLEDSGICVVEEAEVTLRRAQDGGVDLALGMAGS